MSVRRAAFAAALMLLPGWLPGAVSQAQSVLTLERAFQRVLDTHPDLRRIGYEREVLDAQRAVAEQAPPLSVAAEIENAAGTGTASGFDGAEVTLSLASVLERGDKRTARRVLVQRQMDALAMQQEAKRLDLLAEVARRCLDVLAGQTLEKIAQDDLAQRERTVQAAQQRTAAGASPDSVRLAAVASATRARLQRERVRTELEAARRQLASLWGDRAPDFEQVSGELLTPPRVASFEALVTLLEHNPQLRRFADEQRLREARVQLARAASAFDVQWQVGVRRLEESDDWAAVASVAIPIGTRSRAAPGVRAAQSELSALDLERRAEELTLHGPLIEAHARPSALSTETTLAERELLPALQAAETAAERAYRAGALSYREWTQLQTERTTAQREQVAVALQAYRALIEIQRLTGDTLAPGRHAVKE